jgi:hypothetical protein
MAPSAKHGENAKKQAAWLTRQGQAEPGQEQPPLADANSARLFADLFHGEFKGSFQTGSHDLARLEIVCEAGNGCALSTLFDGG